MNDNIVKFPNKLPIFCTVLNCNNIAHKYVDYRSDNSRELIRKWFCVECAPNFALDFIKNA